MRQGFASHYAAHRPAARLARGWPENALLAHLEWFIIAGLGSYDRLERKVSKSWSMKVGFPGTLWGVGWLFAIGFARLHFWKALVALVIWPYFVGARLSGIH